MPELFTKSVLNFVHLSLQKFGTPSCSRSQNVTICFDWIILKEVSTTAASVPEKLEMSLRVPTVITQTILRNKANREILSDFAKCLR